MVVPLSLLADEGEREFFVEGRDRNVEAVYDFFHAVRVLHGILRRLEKRRAVLLRILRASREEVQDVLGSEAYMDRHLPVLHGEYTLTVLRFIHVEHAAVRGEVCRVGTILECQKVPKADKLLQFKIDDGLETRTIVSGIAKHYQPEELVGKQVCFIANLAPRKLKGIVSEGMILSAENNDGSLAVIMPEREVKPGSEVK